MAIRWPNVGHKVRIKRSSRRKVAIVAVHLYEPRPRVALINLTPVSPGAIVALIVRQSSRYINFNAPPTSTPACLHAVSLFIGSGARLSVAKR